MKSYKIYTVAVDVFESILFILIKNLTTLYPDDSNVIVELKDVESTSNFEAYGIVQKFVE